MKSYHKDVMRTDTLSVARTLSVALLAMLLMAACNQQANTPPNTAFESAPAFQLNTPDGQPVSLPGASEQGVDVYLFWATWCPYCTQLMPHLQSMKDEYGDNLNIYAINISENGNPVEYLESNGYDFVLLLEGDDIAKQYDVEGTPGLILVDQNGQYRFNMATLLAPAYKALDGLKHGQRSKRIAPWWAAQIRNEIQIILSQQG